AERTAERVKRPGRVSAEELARGEALYGAVRDEYEGCVGFLKAGLATRFAGVGPDKLDERLRRVEERMEAFLQWAEHAEGEDYTETDPLPELRASAPAVVKLLQGADEAKVRELRTELDGCRLRPWGELRPTWSSTPKGTP